MEKFTYEIAYFITGLFDLVREWLCESSAVPLVVGSSGFAVAGSVFVLTPDHPQNIVTACLAGLAFLTFSLVISNFQDFLIDGRDGHDAVFFWSLFLTPTFVSASILVYRLSPSESTLSASPGYAELIGAALAMILISAVFIAAGAAFLSIVAILLTIAGHEVYIKLRSTVLYLRNRGRSVLDNHNTKQ